MTTLQTTAQHPVLLPVLLTVWHLLPTLPFEINLNAQTATTYAIPANAFTFLNSAAAYLGTAGSLSIGTYDMTNRKISGTFTGVTAGAVTITGGTFTNLPYK